MVRLFFTIFLSTCLALYSFSQQDIFGTLSQQSPGSGKVTLKQDKRIEALVAKHIDLNQKAKGFPGYRVQIYFGSGPNAKNTANKLRSDFSLKFQDIDTYLIYESPYFKVRAGDFRNRNEAYKVFHILKQTYPEAFIVEDLISLPKL